VQCVDLMRAATIATRTVIKTIGDEILAIFPTANDAVNAAGEMQQDIGAHPALAVQGQHVAIRIGCHFGRSCSRTATSSARPCTSRIA